MKVHGTLPACPSDKGSIEIEVNVENCKQIPQIEEVEVAVRQWLRKQKTDLIAMDILKSCPVGTNISIYRCAPGTVLKMASPPVQ